MKQVVVSKDCPMQARGNKFESERAQKKLALITYFLKSKGELPCVINTVFSTVKW